MKKIDRLIVLPLLMMAACSKEKKEPAKGCFIREIKETNVDLQSTSKWDHVLMYNDDGSVAKVISTNLNDPGKTELELFSYATNKIFVDHFVGNPGKLTSRDSIILDNNKRIAGVYRKDENGELATSETMEFDGDGQVVKFINGSRSRAYQNGQLVFSQFTYGSSTLGWAGGDIVNWDNQVSMDYYDTAYNVGAIAASYDDLMDYGRAVRKRTRLRKTWASNADTLYSTYQLDANGKIVKWVEASKTKPTNYTLEYTYECK